MRTLTIEAASLKSARGLYDALTDFEPELIEAGNVYRVKVTLGRGDHDTIHALNTIERYVTERADGPAEIKMEGRTLTLHATGEAAQAVGDDVE